jgi:hypothetical protein
VTEIMKRCIGGVVGGALGVLLFWAGLRMGIYFLAVVGPGVGMGAGWPAMRKSLGWGAIASLAAVSLSILTEWHFSPFVDDESLLFFLRNLWELTFITKISFLISAILGYYFGMGQDRVSRS